MRKPLYQHMASKLDAMSNCWKSGNDKWLKKHGDMLDMLCRNFLPSGSGIDSGTTLDKDNCDRDRLMFNTSFHHMNDVGYYDGWTDHAVIVTPSLIHEIDIRITGRNRNDIKDYLHEVFRAALTQEVDDADFIESIVA